MRRGNYTRNPAYYLAAYGLQNAWTVWLLRRSGLMDLQPRAPTEDDVLEPETAGLLPRPVRRGRSSQCR